MPSEAQEIHQETIVNGLIPFSGFSNAVVPAPLASETTCEMYLNRVNQEWAPYREISDKVEPAMDIAINQMNGTENIEIMQHLKLGLRSILHSGYSAANTVATVVFFTKNGGISPEAASLIMQQSTNTLSHLDTGMKELSNGACLLYQKDEHEYKHHCLVNGLPFVGPIIDHNAITAALNSEDPVVRVQGLQKLQVDVENLNLRREAAGLPPNKSLYYLIIGLTIAAALIGGVGVAIVMYTASAAATTSAAAAAATATAATEAGYVTWFAGFLGILGAAIRK